MYSCHVAKCQKMGEKPTKIMHTKKAIFKSIVCVSMFGGMYFICPPISSL